MKNKLCYILLGVLISFSFMGNVFALEVETKNLDFTVTATPSATTVVKGNEVKITLNLKSDSSISLCHFHTKSDSTLEYVSMNTIISEGNTWTVGGGSINNFTLENDANNTKPLTNGVNVLEIKYKVNGDGKFTIKNVDCTKIVDGAENDLEGTLNDIVVDIKTKDISDDTTLKELKVTGGTLLNSTPTENGYYAITLDSPTFGLNAVASNPDYDDDIVYKDGNGNVISDPSNITFKGDGGQKQMLMSIIVNNTTIYNLLISYEQKELDNSLKSITINGVSLPLDECQDVCEYTIGKDVTSFDVEAVLSDSTNFKFGENSNAPGNFTIKDIVDVVIVVEPISSDMGASSVTYNVRVTREDSLDNGSTDKEEDKEDEKPNSGNTGNTGNNGGSGNGGGSSTDKDGNVTTNQQTGDISMFLMAIILIGSLFGSIILYQKNLESYK